MYASIDAIVQWLRDYADNNKDFELIRVKLIEHRGDLHLRILRKSPDKIKYARILLDGETIAYIRALFNTSADEPDKVIFLLLEDYIADHGIEDIEEW